MQKMKTIRSLGKPKVRFLSAVNKATKEVMVVQEVSVFKGGEVETSIKDRVLKVKGQDLETVALRFNANLPYLPNLNILVPSTCSDNALTLSKDKREEIALSSNHSVGEVERVNNVGLWLKSLIGSEGETEWKLEVYQRDSTYASLMGSFFGDKDSAVFRSKDRDELVELRRNIAEVLRDAHRLKANMMMNAPAN